MGGEPASVPGRGEDCEGIAIDAIGDSIVMTQEAAMLNCCADISVAVERPLDHLIRFAPRESGELCFCICPYDLKAGVTGLADGRYEVQVLDVFGEVICRRWVQVDGAGVSAVASGCLDGDTDPGGVDGETVEVWAEGSTIVIGHRGAELNCCLELAVEVEGGPGLYRVSEVDRGEQCDCLCPFSFELRIPDVPTGTHLVELIGVDGATLTTVTVSVP
jgi:hypothetical protein